MKTIKIEDQVKWLEKRKAELGIEGNNFVPLNSGKRRTKSKRELLKTLNEVPNNPFKANY